MDELREFPSSGPESVSHSLEMEQTREVVALDDVVDLRDELLLFENLLFVHLKYTFFEN